MIRIPTSAECPIANPGAPSPIGSSALSLEVRCSGVCAAEKGNITLKLETRARELLLRGGKVIGVRAEDSAGKKTAYKAPGA